MSGEKLTRTGLSAQSGFGKQMPADFEALGTMVRDLVHHAVIEMKYPVKYWGVWNEPNGPSFWNGTMEDYFRLYDVCAIAVKAVDPSLQIGGPEVAGYEPNWLEGLIQHCAREKVPLDFVSWHYYGSTVNEIPRLRAQVDYWAAQDGLKPGIPLICGEWCWHIHNFPRTGYVPWRTRNYYINDWHAAFVAASLIEMQRAGVVYGIYTAPVAEADGAGFDATGLASSKNPWANLNVFRLWSKLSTDILKTDYRGRPGIFALASRDPTGRITILLASLRYRKDTTTRIAIELPGLPKGSHMSEFDVDDEHSNEYDAGPAHAELEQVGGSVLQGSEAIAILKARSVHLLVIEPSK
jgi:hypothetical protein